jgi:NOL1/NOP2/fmu family ribosome biogenesis protein
MAEPILNKLVADFGINPEPFEDLELMKIGDELYIMSKEVAAFKHLGTYRRGIKLAQVFAHSSKFAVGAIQLFGKSATKNTIQLNYAESFMFAQGQEFAPREKLDENSEGFVIAKYKQFPIGIGNYKEGKLKSSIPRSQVVRLGVRRRKVKYKKR